MAHIKPKKAKLRLAARQNLYERLSKESKLMVGERKPGSLKAS